MAVNSGAPSFALFLLEGQRALLERMTLRPAGPLLRSAPRGTGQPVLLLPGFTAGDGSTAVLRRYLSQQGFSPHPWLQGVNRGPHGGVAEAMIARVADLHRRYRRKVSIVGWSLGGVYARELAKGLPEQIRQVVTLGSPFADVARSSNASRLFDFLSRREPGSGRATIADALRLPPPMPSTSIFTKTDGVVHWSTCLEPETDHTENIEVPGSHCGLGFNPLVLYAVADRLSMPEERWQPFAYGGWRKLAYR